MDSAPREQAGMGKSCFYFEHVARYIFVGHQACQCLTELVILENSNHFSPTMPDPLQRSRCLLPLLTTLTIRNELVDSHLTLQAESLCDILTTVLDCPRLLQINLEGMKLEGDRTRLLSMVDNLHVAYAPKYDR